MNLRQTLRAAALTTACLAIPALAQSPAPMLVQADWLSQHLNDPKLVLLHVGDKKEYDVKHIHGAQFIAVTEVVRPMDHASPASKELMYELPSAEDLRAKFSSFGISDDSHVVIYYANEGVFPAVTRIVFTLDYLGMGDRTSVLNGGLAAWAATGKPVDAVVPVVKAGKLSARPPKSLVVDAETVKSIGSRSAQKLVDARAPGFYNGTQPSYEKNGHIPGALSIPFTQIIGEGHIIDRDRIATAFQTAGVRPGDTVVAYCHIGMQATVVIFGARLLGNPVKLYDGSFQDWAINDRGPVEK